MSKEEEILNLNYIGITNIIGYNTLSFDKNKGFNVYDGIEQYDVDKYINKFYLTELREKVKTTEIELQSKLKNNKLIKEKRELELKYVIENNNNKLSFYNATIRSNKSDIKALEKEKITIEGQLIKYEDKLKEITTEEVSDLTKEINEFKDKIQAIETEILQYKSYQSKQTQVIELLDKEITVLIDEIENHKNLFQEFRDKKFKRIKELRSQLGGDNDYEIKQQLVKIDEELPPVFDKKTAENNIISKGKEIDVLNDSIIDKDTIILTLTKEKNLNESLLSQIVEKQDKLITKYNIENAKFKLLIERTVNNISKTKGLLQDKEFLIKQKQDEITKYEEDILLLKNDDLKIQQIELSFEEFKQSNKNIEDKLKIVSWWNNEGIDGLKKYIYKRLIDNINKYVSNFNYTNKKIENICVFLGLNDLIDKSNSIVFEKLDEGLDNEAKEILYEILLSKNKCIYILSNEIIEQIPSKKYKLINNQLKEIIC